MTYASQQQHDPRISRLRKNPDLLIREMETADIDRDGHARYRLLMRAGWACMRDIEASLPTSAVEAVNRAFLSRELNRHNRVG